MTLDRLRRQEWRLAPALRDYIKRPYFCPFCEHPVIEATKLESFENIVYQWVRCPECETEWHDLFELYGIEEVVAGK
jgi:transcription elongation factor Elf1